VAPAPVVMIIVASSADMRPRGALKTRGNPVNPAVISDNAWNRIEYVVISREKASISAIRYVVI